MPGNVGYKSICSESLSCDNALVYQVQVSSVYMLP